MDKNQQLLFQELEQLKPRIKSDPQAVLDAAELCMVKANQILFPEGVIHSLIIISRCHWSLMDFRKGLKHIRDAYSRLIQIDNDDALPEILHITALQLWGQAKFYSAQQYWIRALEQSALVEDTHIQIEALIGLGNVWRVFGEYELAKSTHELAVKVANSLRIDWLEGKSRILLAWDLQLLGHHVEMLSILDGAEEVLQDHNDATWQAEIWDFRGLAMLGLERLEDADIATQKAQQLVEQHDLIWMRAHSYLSRARLEAMRDNPTKATELLQVAEAAAISFEDGELLSQILFQLSRVAEQRGDFKAALDAFKRYRENSVGMLREQTFREGNDKARASKRLLEKRAFKLINRIRTQYEYDPNKHMSQVVSENYWWEKLVLFKTQLKQTHYSVITIFQPKGENLDICLEVAHTLCNDDDLLSRISTERIGFLVSETEEKAQQLYDILRKMMAIYPWQRRSESNKTPIVELHNILAFPFTLEQLEEESLFDEDLLQFQVEVQA